MAIRAPDGANKGEFQQKGDVYHPTGVEVALGTQFARMGTKPDSANFLKNLNFTFQLTS